MMQYSPVILYGLLVYESDLQPWWDKGTEGYGTDTFERENFSLFEVNEVLEEGNAFVVDEDCDGDVYSLNEDGKLTYFSNDSRPEDFLILETERGPSLFSAAYNSKAEVIKALQKTYASILPDNFDFDGRLVCYEGVCWG